MTCRLFTGRVVVLSILNYSKNQSPVYGEIQWQQCVSAIAGQSHKELVTDIIMQSFWVSIITCHSN